ncbi:hypothetical protein PYCCODRAFT_1473256 [Trametes coccinea BRFM310]|uniref:Aminoglycoside phosphotransferase domain-containing protein n=1 Tax=Trametes coccinea (strain BRFM310) TaxID=1353009 RepID=A0A1Y2J5J8_TRAC3|nr:hypothetical protein PYCCODRAFT_1473256 [Trametes coccinea BRFM310]
MTSLNISLALLERYLEEDLWAMEIPPYNLKPYPPREDGDTPEFRAAACEVAQRTGVNPLERSYGSCPFILTDVRVLRIGVEMPFNANTPVFKVRVGDDLRLLKIFRNKEVSLQFYYKPQDAPPHPMIRFASEIEAYAHLQHYGACDAGAVPKCFGWLELTSDDLEAIAALPVVAEEWRYIKEDELPPKALLLEWFEGAQQLSIDNVTPAIADAGLRALYRVHASFVMHGDVHRRNILVLPGGRVVWIDFDAAFAACESTPDNPMRRQELFCELHRAWVFFYGELLPDKRIGFRHWLS